MLEMLPSFLTWTNLAVVMAGSTVGLIIGVLPGLGGVFGLALFLPVTFTMSQEAAFTFLISLHGASMFGGAIPAITLNIPGTASTIATTFDGFPMARQGKALVALGASLSASFIGGMAGFLAFYYFSPVLADFGVRITPATYFALILLGLSFVSMASQGSMLKGLMMGAAGLMLSFIGLDLFTSESRYTMGQMELDSGVSFVAVTIGLFALSQAFRMVEERRNTVSERTELQGSFGEGMVASVLHVGTLVRSIPLGVLIGVIPGAGSNIANLVAYYTERSVARNPGNFGKGDVRGVISGDSANNACAVSEMIPALALGIPGGPPAALLMAALMMHGLRPGFQFFASAGDSIYLLFWGMIFAQIAFLTLGFFAVRYYAWITLVPSSFIITTIMVLAFIGTYAHRRSALDLIVMCLFGIIGYWASKRDYPLGPLILGLVLGELAEVNFRRALTISDGSYAVFLTAAPLIVFTITLVGALWPFLAPRLLRRWQVPNDAGNSRESA